MHKLAPFVVMALAACGGAAAQSKTDENPAESRSRRVPVDDGETSEDDEGGEDDGLTVEGLLGTLARADIQPVIEQSWDDVQACYTGGVGKLRYVGGQLELAFRVARDGSVKRVHVVRGTLGAWPVERCILELAAGMQFPEPDGGEAEFTFPIDFPLRGKVVAMDDGLAASDLGPLLPELDACAEEAGGAVPPLQVTLYVAAGGKVTSAGFSAGGEQPIPAAWGDCAHAAIVAWRVTDPRGTVAKASVMYEGP